MPIKLPTEWCHCRSDSQANLLACALGAPDPTPPDATEIAQLRIEAASVSRVFPFERRLRRFPERSTPPPTRKRAASIVPTTAVSGGTAERESGWHGDCDGLPQGPRKPSGPDNSAAGLRALKSAARRLATARCSPSEANCNASGQKIRTQHEYKRVGYRP